MTEFCKRAPWTKDTSLALSLLAELQENHDSVVAEVAREGIESLGLRVGPS